jgi:hypothetical protein
VTPTDVMDEEGAMADTATTEETAVELDGDQWVFLVDPAWSADDADGAGESRPPTEAVVGGWFVAEDGTTGRFQANPAYEPSRPDSPTDPVDALLQLVVRGDGEAGDLLDEMRDAVFGLAVDADNTPVVVLSPDEVPCVLVATAPAHSRRIMLAGEVPDIAAWVEIELAQLVDVLPEQGVDLLLNPGAPASMRMLAAALHEVVADADAVPATESHGPAGRPAEETDESDSPSPGGSRAGISA